MHELGTMLDHWTVDMNEIISDLKSQILGEDLIITSVSDAKQFHGKFIDLRVQLFVNYGFEVMPHYRGEQKFGWDILPGIFRQPDMDGIAGKKLELKAIQLFEKEIIEKAGKSALKSIFNKEKYGREWDLLFQAQHAGVKTTLTDWTAAILIALYFSTEKSADQQLENSDGQLWCLLMPTQNILLQDNENNIKSLFRINPFEIKNKYLINPTTSYLEDMSKQTFEDRRRKQGGRFLVLPNEICHVPINQSAEMKDFLICIKIPSTFKGAIREELEKIGITRSWLYVIETTEMRALISKINHDIFGVS
jgi:hypothetical protein